jgi:outer membrane biogenesis lipoprotein LolB
MKTLFVLFALALFIWVQMPRDRIIKSITDDRGLTSIQYQQDGKVWALDYLTKQELDSVVNTFH